MLPGIVKPLHSCSTRSGEAASCLICSRSPSLMALLVTEFFIAFTALSQLPNVRPTLPQTPSSDTLLRCQSLDPLDLCKHGQHQHSLCPCSVCLIQQDPNLYWTPLTGPVWVSDCHAVITIVLLGLLFPQSPRAASASVVPSILI